MNEGTVRSGFYADLRGKVALVTGAGRGIGFAIAQRLGRDGALVAISDIDAGRAREAADLLSADGIQAIAIGSDVSSESDAIAMVETVQQAFGRLDVLVNNAGVVSTGSILGVSAEEWRRVMSINLDGVFHCVKAALPGMMERRSGRIINIASVAGKRGGGLLGNSCYAASKGGVIALTKGIAREAGPFGITVNAITPALTDTEMTQSLQGEARDRVLADMPLGRAGTPAVIASAVCFLASDGAAFITGEIMDVDGGYMRD
jgi:NAD(P)-dependent dehydrogenase (short-subunit alcohol dehydrogenase family)